MLDRPAAGASTTLRTADHGSVHHGLRDPWPGRLAASQGVAGRIPRARSADGRAPPDVPVAVGAGRDGAAGRRAVAGRGALRAGSRGVPARRRRRAALPIPGYGHASPPGTGRPGRSRPVARPDRARASTAIDPGDHAGDRPRPGIDPACQRLDRPRQGVARGRSARMGQIEPRLGGHLRGGSIWPLACCGRAATPRPSAWSRRSARSPTAWAASRLQRAHPSCCARLARGTRPTSRGTR